MKDNMDEVTTQEIADSLGIPLGTTKCRIKAADIEAVRKVGRTNIYNREIIEMLRNPPPRGRPKAKPEPEAKVKKG